MCVLYSTYYFFLLSTFFANRVFLPHRMIKIGIEVLINCETLILELSIWREELIFHSCRSDMTKIVVQSYCPSHSMLPFNLLIASILCYFLHLKFLAFGRKNAFFENACAVVHWFDASCSNTNSDMSVILNEVGENSIRFFLVSTKQDSFQFGLFLAM